MMLHTRLTIFQGCTQHVGGKLKYQNLSESLRKCQNISTELLQRSYGVMDFQGRLACESSLWRFTEKKNRLK